MNVGLGVAFTAALAIGPTVAWAADIKSGPEKVIGGPFNVKAVTGDNKGKTLCYV